MNNVENEEARLLRDIDNLKIEVLKCIACNTERIAKLEERADMAKKIKIGKFEVEQNFIIHVMLITALIFLTLDKAQQDRILKINEAFIAEVNESNQSK